MFVSAIQSVKFLSHCFLIFFADGGKSTRSAEERNKASYFQGHHNEEPIVRYGSFYLRLGAIGNYLFSYYY